MKTTFKVKRYAQGWNNWQVLYKTWWLFGIPIWRRAIDEEEVPGHVVIQYGAFGDWTGWRSKFYEHIK